MSFTDITSLHGKEQLDAARDGQVQQLKRLLNRGGNINYTNWDGNTALHLAASNNKTEIVNLLIRMGCNLNLQNEDDNTAIHLAVWNGISEIANLLTDAGIDLNLQNKDGNTALHLAVWNGTIKIATFLINRGIDLNVQNKEDDSALHLASINRQQNIAKELAHEGIDLNLQNKSGKTALHCAAQEFSLDTANILIEYGCAKNIQDNDGNTALHIASKHEHKKLVTYLLSRDCDITLLNNDGMKPIELADEPDIIKLIKDYENSLLPGLPTEVKKLDKKSAQVFSSLLREESYFHYESRVMLAGEQGTGKTTIARYLVGKTPTRFRMSTDGIELYNGLSFMDRESKEWIDGHKDFSLEEVTVSRSLSQDDSQTTSDQLEDSSIIQHVPDMTPDLSISYSERIIMHELDDLSTFVEVSEGSDNDDFSSTELAVSRSLLQTDKRTESDYLEDTMSTKNDVPDMTQDVSLHNNEGNLKYKSTKSFTSNAVLREADFDGLSSTKSFTTEHENVKTCSRKRYKSVPVITCRRSEHMKKQLSRHLSEQRANPHSEKCTHKTDIHDQNPRSEREPGKQRSDEVRKWNKEVKQDYHKVKENTDSDYKKIGKPPIKIGKPIDLSNDARLKTIGNDDMHIQTVTKPSVIGTLKSFFGVTKNVENVKVSITKKTFLQMSSKVGKKLLHNKKIAPILIWDFGGQDVFYSTHQTFLTYRAIYMIVLDGSRKLDDPCPYEQYLPGKSGHKTARDYLLFWINTIVTYCKGSVQGFPKIMVVLTHKDKVKADEVEQRRNELFAEIRKMFGQTPLMRHLVIEDKIFVNARDKHDPEMVKIKNTIIRESEMQPTWGESLPKCFIPLELEFASLIRRHITLITLDHLKKINSQQPIRPLTDSELTVFLKFQHSVGKVLYFDEHRLKNHVILCPTHLIDAFKSIVTDRRFCQGDTVREELWDVLGQKGVVSKKQIQQIWKKKKYLNFYKNKEYLLDVMTHLDILVEPKRYDSDRKRIPADFFYVASMVRAQDDSGYLQAAGFTHRSVAIAFRSSSSMIPPALSFRFISYCLYVWAVKTYGETKKDMLFHRSGVFTIDPALDMCIVCEDEMIIVRLVHTTSNTLIMRDVASSIAECLSSALEKISQLYIRTSSHQIQTFDASFMTSICCNSLDNPCVFHVNHANPDKVWICPSHGIEHSINTITSWIAGKDEEKCNPGCPVTNEEFLRATPSDLHLRRLSLLYGPFAAKELAIHLGWSNRAIDAILETEDPKTSSFEILRQCRDIKVVKFKDIKEALEQIGKENIHILCKLVKGESIYFDIEPEKWDLIPTEEHLDRLAPLVGKNSLPFLIELEMEFHTWEQISHRQNERDLVRLNRDILEEWRFNFCRMHSLKPTLRKIAHAFSNIGKDITIVDNTLSDLF